MNIDYEFAGKKAVAHFGGKWPEHVQDGIARYIEHGIPPGHFLKAIFSNDLVEAYGRADLKSRAGIPALASFLFNSAPMGCWGDKEKYLAWIAKGGLRGKIKL